MLRRKAFRTLAFGFIVLGMARTVTGVIWPSVAETFNRPIAQLGLVTLLFGSGYTLSSLLSGRFVARRGIGQILVSAAATALAALAALAVSPSWSVFLFSVAVLGFGGGLVDSATNTYVALGRDARAMGLIHGVFGLGAVGGPLLVTLLLTAGMSWRFAFAALAIAQAAYVLGLWAFARDLSVDAHTESAGKERGLIRDSTAIASLAAFFLYAGVGGGAGVWAFTYLTEEVGIAGTASGLVVAAYWGALTASRLAIGAIGDRFDANTLLRWSGAATVGAFCVMWWADAPWLAAMALVFAGFAHGPFFPLEILLTAVRFSADRTAKMVGFEIAAANVGAALLPGLMGVAVGIESLAVIPPILTINACLLWGAIETLRWSTRQRRRGTTIVG